VDKVRNLLCNSYGELPVMLDGRVRQAGSRVHSTGSGRSHAQNCSQFQLPLPRMFPCVDASRGISRATSMLRL
jgi:hypothetical protein